MSKPIVYQLAEGTIADLAEISRLASYFTTEPERVKILLLPASGDTRKKLVELSDRYNEDDPGCQSLLDKIRSDYHSISKQLLSGVNEQLDNDLANMLVEIEWMLEEEPHPDPLFNYGQIVAMGSLLSSRLVAAWAALTVPARWIDMRNYISTDNSYNDGHIRLEQTKAELLKLSLRPGELIIGQADIGCTTENFNTVLSGQTADQIGELICETLGAEIIRIDSLSEAGTESHKIN